MRECYSKIFNTTKYPGRLEEMLSLYSKGWGFKQLSRKYGCDHTTIMHHVRLYKVVPVKLSELQKKNLTKRIAKIQKYQYSKKPPEEKVFQEPSKYQHITDRTINHGKARYRDYVNAYKELHKSKLDVMVGL